MKIKIRIFTILVLSLLTGISGALYAHCDSYDGPVIKDALKALEINNINLVLKWVDQKNEQEIIDLFNKTYSLKGGDKEIYEIIEKHFLETLSDLNTHISKVVGMKYEKVIALAKTKDETVEKGREYVAAYIDYTHTLEAIDGILENGALHLAHE